MNYSGKALGSFFSVFLVAFLFQAQAVASGVSCSEVFVEKLAPKSIHYYLRLVEERQNPELTPRFLDPEVEAALVPKWQGTRDVPRSVKDTLLDTTAVIDYALMAADSGTVKMADPGSFLSFRLNERWEGKDMSTNVGMTGDALLARSIEKTDMLVPSTAKGVFIFLHGGGTKTTGHHVAASIANFFNQLGIVVLAVDAPFHGYGPRVQDLTPTEYYMWLRDFRHKYIPAHVKTFVGGHSMGGLHADNIMRLSDRPELGFREAFAGAINLSGPMDAAPGKGLREKNRVEDTYLENKELMETVPAAERDFNMSLLLAGKTSALGGMSAGTFISQVNWVKPKHNGKEYLPTLAIMGERDALYVGREHLYKEHVADLTNVTSHLIGKRTDIYGEEAWISHIIFDHHRPGTKKVEVFQLIKEFMEAQLGAELKVEPGRNDDGSLKIDKNTGEPIPNTQPLLANIGGANAGTVAKVIQTYYNNLAFRIFAKRYSIIVKDAKPAVQEMGPRQGEIGRRLKALGNEIKAIQKDPAQADLLAQKREEMAALQKEMAEINGLLKSTFVPGEGHPLFGLKDFAEANVARRNEINNEITNKQDGLMPKKRELVKQLDQARRERDQVEKEHNTNVEKELGLAAVSNTALAAARSKAERALDEMIDLQIKMNDMTNELVAQNHEAGIFAVNPTPQMIRVFRELDGAYAKYNEASAQLRAEVEKAIGNGELGPDAAAAMTKLWGSVEAFTSNKPAEGSIMARITELSRQIEEIELQMSRLNKESDQLLVEYIEKVTPDLYDVRVTTLEGEMNRPIEDLLANSGKLSDIWGDWTKIWKERPPEQATSLY